MKVLIDGVEYAPVAAVIPDGYLSPHFRIAEMECNHCGSMGGHTVHQELLAALEDCRAYFGDIPITINSGYRCKTHNTNVGSNEASQHRVAKAADIVVKDTLAADVATYLESKDPGRWGIGRYNSFTHIDVRGVPARWTG